MKPVKLNQLLFHPKNLTTLSFFLSTPVILSEFDAFLDDMQLQLSLRGKHSLEKILSKNKANIKKILKNHPDKAHGFFLSEDIQGYIVLEAQVETYCLIGNNFHVRPLLEELFVNLEYLVVNVSLYDINVYRGDFHHLEIIQQYEFEQLSIDLKSRLFSPHHVGLVPYNSILALKTIAHKIMELTEYESIPVIVTGLEETKGIFLKYFTQNSGVIAHFQDDFYEKTCVQILERCKQFKYSVIDYYSVKFKEKLKKMLKSKRLLSTLDEIIEATRKGNVIQLVIPTEKKLFGRISFETGHYELDLKAQKKSGSVDLLNELAEEVIRKGGKIQILAPHFFPQDSYVLAIVIG